MYVTVGMAGLLHRYPSHSPKRRLRRAPLPTILVDLHTDLIQPRAVALHEQHLILVARIRFTQQDSRVQLQVLGHSSDAIWQLIEEPHMRARWTLNRRLAQYRCELGRDGRERAVRGEHSQMGDALRSVRVHRD
jgi:hypothetical protein